MQEEDQGVVLEQLILLDYFLVVILEAHLLQAQNHGMVRHGRK